MINRLRSSVFFAALLVASHALADDGCMYLNDRGEVKSVYSRNSAPAQYRSRVVCAGDKPQELAKPDEVKLQGPVGRASLSTELGPIEVRWPRSIEECFGRSPARAASDAAAAVNRALKSARFSSSVRYERHEWTIVFTDKAAAVREFPASLSIGGHPGFMVPPAQIYLIADYISPDCAKGGVADAMLTQVLLHDMGHAVEFVLLGEQQMSADRQRAEGFASWFEQYASDFASVIPAGSVRGLYRTLALQGLEAQSGSAGFFSGTAQDYAVASLPFSAIVERRGISGLMDVYEAMKSKRLSFDDAVESELNWNRATLERESKSLLSRSTQSALK